jgi:long-chain acyl-CoA synthetase
MRRVQDGFLRKAVEAPAAPAVWSDGRWWTRGEIASAAEERAGKLAGLAGRRVGLCCPNGVGHIVWALAVLRAGGCLVPVPVEASPAERAGLVRLTGVAAVLGADGEVLAEGGGRGDFAEEDFAALDPALVRFSSGTTGEAKGVVLSHRALIERLESANRRLGIREEDRVLWVLPMAHHFAVSIMLYLSVGAGVVVADGMFGGDMLEAGIAQGATVFYGTPYHAGLLAADGSGRTWSGLRLAVSTAAPLGEETARRFPGRHGVPVTQGFGIIEAGLPLVNRGHEREQPLCCGVPDDFEARVAEDGELWLRGPGMFDAYLSPWALRSDVTVDGWFATGDLAERQENGNIRIVGRKKAVINVGGMKVFPEEVEEVIGEFAGVRECRVGGVADRRWGMVPVAEVVWVGGKADERGLAGFCRARLAAHKVPVEFRPVERIARTASGKVRRG